MAELAPGRPGVPGRHAVGEPAGHGGRPGRARPCRGRPTTRTWASGSGASPATSRRAVTAGGLHAVAPCVGPLVGLFLAPPGPESVLAPTDYESARALAGNGLYPRFFHAMLRRGVALAPGPYEVLFPGLAHDDAVLAQVVEVAGEAAAEVGAEVAARPA